MPFVYVIQYLFAYLFTFIVGTLHWNWSAWTNRLRVKCDIQPALKSTLLDWNKKLARPLFKRVDYTLFSWICILFNCLHFWWCTPTFQYWRVHAGITKQCFSFTYRTESVIHTIIYVHRRQFSIIINYDRLSSYSLYAVLTLSRSVYVMSVCVFVPQPTDRVLIDGGTAIVC